MTMLRLSPPPAGRFAWRVTWNSLISSQRCGGEFTVSSKRVYSDYRSHAEGAAVYATLGRVVPASAPTLGLIILS